MNYMESLDNDVASEILSRLTVKDLLAFKSTGKRWNGLVSDPSFIRMHGERSESIYGLFVQEAINSKDLDFELVNYIPIGKGKSLVQDTMLEFLPEKVVLLAVCNGLLCCRNCIHEPEDAFKRNPGLCNYKMKNCQKELVIYVCNPANKQWISLKPEGCRVGDTFGLAFNPSGSSPNYTPNFKIVSILKSGEVPNSYSFAIYSSETERWKISKEVCNCDSSIHPNRMVFVNGRFHWLTYDHHIITFHVEQELSQVMKLPGFTPNELYKCRFGICLGDSEGYFHYVCAQRFELQVWILKEYDSPSWALKYNVSLNSTVFDTPYAITYSSLVPRWKNFFNCRFRPLAFHNDVLFIMIANRIHSYNFRTREFFDHCGTKQLGRHFPIDPTVLPYSVTLAQLPTLKGEGALFNKHSSKNSHDRARKGRKRIGSSLRTRERRQRMRL